MRIDIFFDEFINTKFRMEKDLRKTAKELLTGSKPCDLPAMSGYQDSDYLGDNIRDSVKGLPRGKETAIEVYRRFVAFLREKGVKISVDFPPIPIENSFERLMFIAKYLQGEDAKISDLPDILWVSERTIDDDLLRLRGEKDPIQVCGRSFFIPESDRSRGRLRSASTAHPLFLTENLTQVIIMLKGLRAMAENPLYTRYAEATAADIWQQLSEYAKKRIHYVLGELMPEDLGWYESLEPCGDSFSSETQCSVSGNVWLDCMKNDKPFFAEYQEDNKTVFCKNCRFVPGSYRATNTGIVFYVECDDGLRTIESDRIIRSAYTIEELLAD